ncbi:NAD(P)-dependent oxidoreductase [Mesorhizobium hawassense]|uniref:dTDP-4-dehydrorhamnose reductase n=1 Tax=Mesorhizobium hawassense TaxID=1209954 RepID=A0A330I3X0_9HYPH|nr:SDR family oxidoreductase [Mesorhizobium hawassense]RAZ91727.1 NAD(P)-dependent oxidoreductase [Mesorhizobium hawassense]
MKTNRILVLGAGGMLGNAVFRFFSADHRYETVGTLRSSAKKHHFLPREHGSLISNLDVRNDGDLTAVFAETRPDIVVNCVGVIKQLDASRNHLTSLSINASLPHRLAQLSRLAGARLIHVSTDCVFSGSKGNYLESDFADANDLYGRSKFLGEVDYPNAVTLRTSIIGHELESSKSLIDWFLSQKGPVKGYKNAVFSGLPSVEIARVIKEFVMSNAELRGPFHVSAAPISKFDLLSLVARIYGKEIDIIADTTVTVDRSLNSDLFKRTTGFVPDPWPELIATMHKSYLNYNQ